MRKLWFHIADHPDCSGLLHEPDLESMFWPDVRHALAARDVAAVAHRGDATPIGPDEVLVVLNVPQSMHRRNFSKASKRLRHYRRMFIWPSYSFVERHIAAAGRNRTVLMTLEPPSTLEDNFDPEVHARFGAVVTWSKAFSTVDSAVITPHPYLCPPRPDYQFPFDERKIALMVASKKASPHPAELYSAREAIAAKAAARWPNSFDLFGSRWAPGTPGWRGRVDSKIKAHTRYRFGFAFENSAEPDYVTEKIFDCLVGGAVPVYRGAPNITDYVPSDAFVDARQFSGLDDLFAHLESMPEAQWTRMRQAGDAFIASEGMQRHSPQAMADAVLEAVAICDRADEQERRAAVAA